jgi:hypothetical protein
MVIFPHGGAEGGLEADTRSLTPLERAAVLVRSTRHLHGISERRIIPSTIILPLPLRGRDEVESSEGIVTRAKGGGYC